VFAITTAMAESSLAMQHSVIASIALLGMFAAAAVGHAKGYWAPYEGVDAKGEERERTLRSMFSAAAAAGLASYFAYAILMKDNFANDTKGQRLSLAFAHLVAIVLVVIALMTRRMYLRSATGHSSPPTDETPGSAEGEPGATQGGLTEENGIGQPAIQGPEPEQKTPAAAR
jgi:hypothetical protein